MIKDRNIFNQNDEFGNKLRINKKNNKLILTDIDGEERNIGLMKEKENYNVYIKWISFKDHLLRKWNSIGFSIMVIRGMAMEDYLRVVDEDTNTTYSISVKRAIKNKKYGHFYKNKYGHRHEPQWFVPLEKFKKN